VALILCLLEKHKLLLYVLALVEVAVVAQDITWEELAVELEQEILLNIQ